MGVEYEVCRLCPLLVGLFVSYGEFLFFSKRLWRVVCIVFKYLSSRTFMDKRDLSHIIVFYRCFNWILFVLLINNEVSFEASEAIKLIQVQLNTLRRATF